MPRLTICRRVLPACTTRITPSTIVAMTAASVTAPIGGVSTMIWS